MMLKSIGLCACLAVASVTADEEDVHALSAVERAALEWLRLRDSESWEDLSERVEATEEEAWYELGQLVASFERTADDQPTMRSLVDRHMAHRLRADRLTASADSIQGPELREELKATLEAWFDVRQALLALDVWVRMRENEDFERGLYGNQDDRAEEWLWNALEFAGPESVEALRIERAETWGEAMEAVDEELADWWWGLLETDPEGVEPTLAALRTERPELIAALREEHGLSLDLIEGELELNQYLVESSTPRQDEEAIEETVMETLYGGRWPELERRIMELVSLDVRIDRREAVEERRELRRREAELAVRRNRKAFVVEAELTRRLGEEFLIAW